MCYVHKHRVPQSTVSQPTVESICYIAIKTDPNGKDNYFHICCKMINIKVKFKSFSL